MAMDPRTKNMIIRHMGEFGQTLTIHQQAAARAAAVNNEITSLGGAWTAIGLPEDWPTDLGITRDEYIAALSTCEQFPTILGGHGTNLHKAKSQ